jgi:hypothetical protein
MWEFIAGIAVGIVLAKVFRTLSRASRVQDTSAQPRGNDNSSTSNPVDEIYSKAEERRARAKELGLPELMAKLVPDIRHWPSWIEDRLWRPRLLRVVRSAENIDDHVRLDVDGDLVELSFKDRCFTTPDGEYNHHADADLFWQGQRVLSVSMSADEEYGAEVWRPFQIGAFVEGPWVDVLKRIDQKHEASNREEDRLKREAPEKVASLKKDFGLE